MAGDELNGVRRWVARIVGVLVALPVLYALSLGPAVWWAERQELSDQGYLALEHFLWPH